MVLDATDCTDCCTRHSHFNIRVDARRPLSVTVFTFDPPFILPCILDPKDYYRVYLAAQDPSIRARYRETQTAARRVPAHCSTNAGFWAKSRRARLEHLLPAMLLKADFYASSRPANEQAVLLLRLMNSEAKQRWMRSN
jgi:hypothetical protein